MAEKNNELIVNRSDEEILDLVEQALNNWYTYFNVNYTEGRVDKIFLHQAQWDAQEIQDLERLGLPELTFNQINAIVRKISAEQRNIIPDLLVMPKNFYSSHDEIENQKITKGIELRQNILRGILYDSKADFAFKMAGQNAMQSGYGVIQIINEYESSRSFNQTFRVLPVIIPEQAFFDRNALDMTKSDGSHCGIYTYYPIELAKKMYPNLKAYESYPAVSFYEGFRWMDDDKSLAFVDFYKKEFFITTIFQLEDGRVVNEKELKDLKEFWKRNGLPQLSTVQEREAEDYQIAHYRVTYGQVLEKKVFPSTGLPIIFCDGDSYYLDGLQRTQSLIKWAKDPQRFLNYVGVQVANLIKNTRKERFLGTDAMFAGKEHIWANPEIFQGALRYNWDAIAGGKPDVLPPADIPQTLHEHFMRAKIDIQSAIGYYDANLGAPSGEVSGIAQYRKITQGNNSIGKFNDNLMMSIEQTGRVILNGFKFVFDTPRAVPIRFSDGRINMINVNQPIEDNKFENDLRDGEFDVMVKATMSFEAQKDMILEYLLKGAALLPPESVTALIDLIFDNMPIPNRQQLVDRARAFVPPQILAKEEGKEIPPSPPPQPTPDQQIKMDELQIKQGTLQQNQEGINLKKQQQIIDAMKMLLMHREELTQQDVQKLSHFVEMYKADLDHKSSVTNALSKLFDFKS